jgi:hypothetical protein
MKEKHLRREEGKYKKDDSIRREKTCIEREG